MKRYRLVITLQMTCDGKTVGNRHRRVQVLPDEAVKPFLRVMQQPTLTRARQRMGLEFTRMLMAYPGPRPAGRSGGSTSPVARKEKHARRASARARQRRQRRG
jgi:hypothetical protein